MQENPYGLTNKEIKKCENLLDTGFDGVNKASYNSIMRKNNLREFLDWRRCILEEGSRATYRFKVEVIHFLIEHSLSSLSKADSWQERECIKKFIVIAIHELNVMQGHISPSRQITTSSTYTPTNILETMNKVLEVDLKNVLDSKNIVDNHEGDEEIEQSQYGDNNDDK